MNKRNLITIGGVAALGLALAALPPVPRTTEARRVCDRTLAAKD